MNRFVGIGVSQAVQAGADLDFDSQFLAEFANQALRKRLIPFAFASRKLPQTAQVRLRRALGDEQFAVSEDQAGGNLDGRTGRGGIPRGGVVHGSHLTLVRSTSPSDALVNEPQPLHLNAVEEVPSVE